MTALLAVFAVLASPLVAASSADAAEIAGSTSGSPGVWQDATLDSDLTVGEDYESSVQAPAGYTLYRSLLADLPDGLTASLDPDTGIITVSGAPTTAVSNRASSLSLFADGMNNFTVFFYLTVVGPAPVLSGSTTWVASGTTTPVTTVEPGDALDLMLTLDNIGDEVSSATSLYIVPTAQVTTGDVTISGAVCDDLGQTFSCTIGDLVPGAGVQVRIAVTVNADATDYYINANSQGSNNSGGDATVTYASVPIQYPADSWTMAEASLYTNLDIEVDLGWGGDTQLAQFYIGGVPLGDELTVTDGVARYSGPVDPSFAGTDTIMLSHSAGIYSRQSYADVVIYSATGFSGNIYLNGALYTGDVEVQVANLPFAPLGQFTINGSCEWPTMHGTTMSAADATQEFVVGARIPGTDALTTYNSYGFANSLQYTTISPVTFSDEINMYFASNPTWTDSVLAAPTYNVPYSDSVTATSNVPLVYEAFGTLPAGLSFNTTTHTLEGTPTDENPSYDFSIAVSHDYGYATIAYTAEAIAWGDDAIGDFQVGVPYADSVAATATPAATYTVSVGALPAGVLLDPDTGALEGEPSAAGSVAFTITASNGVGSISTSYAKTVAPALIGPSWLDSTLGDLRVGETLVDEVVADGEPAPTYWSNDLPSWATLDGDSGAVTASPLTEEDYDFTITAGNSEGSVDQRFQGTVLPAWISPTFTKSTILPLQAGVHLDDQVTASGDGLITYSVVPGTMPSWLTLNTTNGLISGTPPLTAVDDVYSFTITASGYGLPDTATIDGVVEAAPYTELDIDFSVGDTAAGAEFGYEVAGAGEDLPFSVTVNSTPVIVASGTIGAPGTAAGTAAIPLGITPGAHSIVLLTYAYDGTPRTSTVWFTILADGTIGAISLTGPFPVGSAALAFTGLDLTPALASALFLMLAGYLVMRRTRRVRVS